MTVLLMYYWALLDFILFFLARNKSEFSTADSSDRLPQLSSDTKRVVGELHLQTALQGEARHEKTRVPFVGNCVIF